MSNEFEIVKRHVQAVARMLLSRKMMQPGVAIVAGEVLDGTKRMSLGQMARESDTDIIHLAFHHADTGYGMAGITLAAPRDSIIYSYPDCRLSLIGKRTFIVPPDHVRGHFALEPGELVHKPAKPDGWCDGVARAERRLAQLVADGVDTVGQIALHTTPSSRDRPSRDHRSSLR